AMYALLSDDAQARTSRASFREAYEKAADTLTLERVITGKVRKDGHAADVAVRFVTRIFGTLNGDVVLPAGDRAAGGSGVDWTPDLVYPGLRAGETLRRTTVMPPRATLEARDGTVIAKGPNRTSNLGPLAGQIAGTIGPAPADEAQALAA